MKPEIVYLPFTPRNTPSLSDIALSLAVTRHDRHRLSIVAVHGSNSLRSYQSPGSIFERGYSTYKRLRVVAKVEEDPIDCLLDRQDPNSAFTMAAFHARVFWFGVLVRFLYISCRLMKYQESRSLSFLS